MSKHQCMMSYAQGSNVGTTSTSVPECRKEMPDRLDVCTVKRTVKHRLLLTQGGNHQHNRTATTTGSTEGRSRTTWTGPPEPTEGRRTASGQHNRTTTTTGSTGRGDHTTEWGSEGGGGSNPGSYIGYMQGMKGPQDQGTVVAWTPPKRSAGIL